MLPPGIACLTQRRIPVVARVLLPADFGDRSVRDFTISPNSNIVGNGEGWWHDGGYRGCEGYFRGEVVSETCRAFGSLRVLGEVEWVEWLDPGRALGVAEGGKLARVRESFEGGSIFSGLLDGWVCAQVQSCRVDGSSGQDGCLCWSGTGCKLLVIPRRRGGQLSWDFGCSHVLRAWP